MSRELTLKQKKFIEVYAGNGTEAARLAGYKGNENALAVAANELLRNPKIADAIANREKKIIKPLIADRKKRQEFWSRVMFSKKEFMQTRLKASELLAKSDGDFIQKHEVTGKDGGAIETKSTLKISIEDRIEQFKSKK